MQIQTGSNSSKNRAENRALVLRHLATRGAISRIELSQLMGLTKMTLSNITQELINEGLLVETKKSVALSSVGRKPILLDFSPNSPCAAGVWLSRRYLRGILCDLRGQTIYECTEETLSAETYDSLKKKVFDFCRRLTREAERFGRPLWGLGISTIGPLDVQNGILLDPHNFFGVENFPIRQIAQEATGLTVVVENEMHASAIAEQLYGSAGDNFLYIGVSTGIGAGIITNGRLFAGSGGFGGEVGHISVDQNGPLCTCGQRGCLELYAGILRLTAAINEACGLSAGSMKVAIEQSQGDPRADAVLTEAARRIGDALCTAANLLDPERIVLGHHAFFFPDEMLKRIEGRLNSSLVFRSRKKIPVVRSQFDDQAALVGAATLIFERIFRAELLPEDLTTANAE